MSKNVGKMMKKCRKNTEKMLETWEEMPPYFITSASNYTGKEEVLNYINSLNTQFSGSDFH